MAKMTSLNDLYVEQLQDLYDAEKQIIKALPKMAKTASSPDLRQAFERHEEQSRQHAERLERVMQQMGTKPGGKSCKAMQGLIAEGEEMMSMKADPSVMDAGLIAAAQRVEHYEMAGYGCVRTWADMLGQSEAARLLQQTLDEEGQTDKLLTSLAERNVNVRAAAR